MKRLPMKNAEALAIVEVFAEKHGFHEESRKRPEVIGFARGDSWISVERDADGPVVWGCSKGVRISPEVITAEVLMFPERLWDVLESHF
jgi:hypothetical protein